MSQYGGFGQTFDLTFLGSDEISLESFRTKLIENGLSLKKTNPTLDWVEWTRPQGPVILAANTHRGLGYSWIILGFDNRELRSLSTIEDRKRFVDDFLDLGKRLWSAFSLSEGILAPEEGGVLFSTVKEEKFPYEFLRVNYASFLGQEIIGSSRVHEWVHEKYPKVSIQRLAKEGELIIWDSSKEGLARLLEDEFHIV